MFIVWILLLALLSAIVFKVRNYYKIILVEVIAGEVVTLKYDILPKQVMISRKGKTCEYRFMRFNNCDVYINADHDWFYPYKIYDQFLDLQLKTKVKNLFND